VSAAANRTFVIAGGGLAGAKAAETLREEGFDGHVLLCGDEPVRPYERPPLSKDYLRGEAGFDDAAVHAEDFYAEHDIDLRTSCAVEVLDTVTSEVRLSTGERVHYERLLLATGAEPRRLRVPGSELAGIHYLRTVADSDAIRTVATSGVPLVVIGAGWIGAEVAASSRQLGADVAMVDPMAVPLERVLGPEVGAIYRDLHLSKGVRLHLGVGLESFAGDGAVEEVRLSDGTILPAGAVVVGVGVTPRTQLAEAAGIESDNGIVTDACLATSAPGVYAAGDVANTFSTRYGTRIRLEHWSAALNQGPVAAKNMLDLETPYEKLPYFYSDQYELGMEYRGWTAHPERVVFRGDPAGGEFIAFWLEGGVVAAAMNANVWDQNDAIEALLAAGRPVDAEALADPGTDLASLAAADV
jgi:3-phenylpropionate/trans-cinnamate dioxygenase ferredoxin reductase subunit